MKKIIISMMAVAALAACSKSEVQYEPAGEISFAPVSKLNTKAAVTTTDYPDALNMYVFANAGEATDALPSGYDEQYFANAEFSQSGHPKDVFGGVTPYYWPNVKKLIFSGYSKSGNVATMTTKPTYTLTDGKWVINMTGYAPTPGTATLGDNDLMWFPTTTESYGKPATADFTVDVEMKHACSWITINIKGDAITGAANTSWNIRSLTISDLSQSGNVTLGETAIWTPGAGSTFDVFEVAADKPGQPLTTAGEDYTKITTNKKFEDLIIIPQATKTLTVVYQYVSQKGAAADGSEDIVIEESKDIPLTYTNNEGWKPGVHYTYNITIGTQEILIEPTVNEWTPITAPEVVIQ